MKALGREETVNRKEKKPYTVKKPYSLPPVSVQDSSHDAPRRRLFQEREGRFSVGIIL